jgi:hypothetical protein
VGQEWVVGTRREQVENGRGRNGAGTVGKQGEGEGEEGGGGGQRGG